MPNVSLWKKALSGMHRVEKDEFANYDLVAKWLTISRASTLPMTFLSCLITGLLAHKDNMFDAKIFVLVTVGLTFAHATNNLLNDLTDWYTKVDEGNYFRNRYGCHPMRVMDRTEFFTHILFTGLIALGIAIYLCSTRNVTHITLWGAFLVLFYTWPLKHFALGEISVFLAWGPLMTYGAYYCITQQWNWNVVLVGCCYGLGVTFVIFGAHIDKVEVDTEKGIHTLPMVLGDKNARYFSLAMVTLQYVLIIYLVYTKYFSPIMLVTLASLINNKAFTVFSQVKPKTKPKDYPDEVWPLWYFQYSLEHNQRFGGIMLLGLVVEALLMK